MYNSGDKIKVLECHSIPQLVGMEATIIKNDCDGKYPLVIEIAEPIPVKVQPFPGLIGQMPMKQFPFREEELELVGAQGPQGTVGIPDAFLKGMDEPKAS